MPPEDEPQKKLKKLEERIRNAKSGSLSDNDNGQRGDNASYGGISALRIVLEIVAGIAVGMGLGYMVDDFFGTKPLFFIICLFLGVAGAVLNIYKLAGSSQD